MFLCRVEVSLLSLYPQLIASAGVRVTPSLYSQIGLSSLRASLISLEVHLSSALKVLLVRTLSLKSRGAAILAGAMVIALVKSATFLGSMYLVSDLSSSSVKSPIFLFPLTLSEKKGMLSDPALLSSGAEPGI